MCRLLAVNSPLLRYISNLNLRLSYGQRVRAGSPIRLSRNDLQTSETGKEEEQILLNRRLISEMNINSDYHGFFTLMMLFVAKSYKMRNYCSHVHPKTPKERKFPKNNPTGRYGKRIFLKLLQPCPFEISQRTTPLAHHDIAYESFVKG